MKQKLLLIFSILFGLISCSENNNVTSTTSVSLPTIGFNEIVETTSWDDQIENVLSLIVGEENKMLIPEVTAERYVAAASIDETTSIPIAIINCYGTRESYVTKEYEQSLIDNNFLLSSEMPYGFMELTVTKDLVVQYELKLDGNNETCFELLVYTVEFRQENWPSDVIQDCIGEQIPVVTATSYEYYVDYTMDYKIRVSIYAYHVDENEINSYKQKLINDNYIIDDKDMYIDAVSEDGTIHIMFSDYYDDTLYLNVYSDWPYPYIASVLGFDLPKLDNNEATLDFGFVQDGESEVLTIYYDNVDKDALYQYGELLENAGFDFVEENNTQSTFTITERVYVINENNENEHFIKVMYCLEQRALAIAIY